jgi:hypothetical protein
VLCALLLEDLYPGLLDLDLGTQRVELSAKRTDLLVTFFQPRRRSRGLKRTQGVDISPRLLDHTTPETLLFSKRGKIPFGLQRSDRLYFHDQEQTGRKPTGKKDKETMAPALALIQGRSRFLGLLEHPPLQHELRVMLTVEPVLQFFQISTPGKSLRRFLLLLPVPEIGMENGYLIIQRIEKSGRFLQAHINGVHEIFLQYMRKEGRNIPCW